MNGFLTTNGKFHQCSSWEHLELAKKLVKDMNVPCKNGFEKIQEGGT